MYRDSWVLGINLGGFEGIPRPERPRGLSSFSAVHLFEEKIKESLCENIGWEVRSCHYFRVVSDLTQTHSCQA